MTRSAVRSRINGHLDAPWSGSDSHPIFVLPLDGSFCVQILRSSPNEPREANSLPPTLSPNLPHSLPTRAQNFRKSSPFTEGVPTIRHLRKGVGRPLVSPGGLFTMNAPPSRLLGNRLRLSRLRLLLVCSLESSSGAGWVGSGTYCVDRRCGHWWCGGGLRRWFVRLVLGRGLLRRGQDVVDELGPTIVLGRGLRLERPRQRLTCPDAHTFIHR